MKDREPIQARFRLEIDHMRHTMLRHFDQYSEGMSDALDRAIADGLAEAGKDIAKEAHAIIQQECGLRARNLAYIVTDDPVFKERLRQIVIDALPDADL